MSVVVFDHHYDQWWHDSGADGGSSDVGVTQIQLTVC